MAMNLQIFVKKENPNVDSSYPCFAVISLDYVLKKDENHYPQVFLKECKQMVSTVAFVFKVIRPIYFSAVKNVSFPQSRKFSLFKKFSTLKEIVLDQEIFPQSRKVSAVEETLLNDRNFPQSRRCFTKIFFLIK